MLSLTCKTAIKAVIYLASKFESGAKAGILEIGDVYVVNKADLPDAETVVGNLLTNVGLSYPGDGGVNPSSISPRGALKSSSAQHERHGQPGVEPTYWRPPVLRDGARHESPRRPRAAAFAAPGHRRTVANGGRSGAGGGA